jgi:hypothetical protein
VAIAVALAVPVGGGAAVKRRGGGAKREAAGPRALHVRAIDLAKRLVTVELTGFAKPPAANLFSFTDERERHAVAMTVACEEPVDGVRSCALEIPAGYERHRIVDVLVRVGGLHGRPLHAPAAEVQAAWEAATGATGATATGATGATGTKEPE